MNFTIDEKSYNEYLFNEVLREIKEDEKDILIIENEKRMPWYDVKWLDESEKEIKSYYNYSYRK